MKLTTAPLVILLSAAAIASPKRPAAPPLPSPSPIYAYCDPRELVRLAGILVGDPDKTVPAELVYCTSTDLVCDLQRQARNAAAHADLMARLSGMVTVCRAAGY